MDERMKILEERKKKEEEIKSAKRANKLMIQGQTDSKSNVAVISNNGNATRQLYDALGQETLQNFYDSLDSGKMTELNKQQSLPYHDNQS